MYISSQGKLTYFKTNTPATILPENEYLEKWNFESETWELDVDRWKTIKYKELEKLLSEKWLGIQAIAIDKPWMTDQQAIQAQIDSYSKLADGARELLIDDPENEILLDIIAKDVSAKRLLFEANLLMQQVKTILAGKIAEIDPKIDEKLAFAKSFKMSKEDIADADKSAEMAIRLISFLEN